jgi:hypothetical protein
MSNDVLYCIYVLLVDLQCGGSIRLLGAKCPPIFLPQRLFLPKNLDGGIYVDL